MTDVKTRSTEVARDALQRLIDKCWGRSSPHLFTIPVDQERDADCILSDVISERDTLARRVEELEREASQRAIAMAELGEEWTRVVQENDDLRARHTAATQARDDAEARVARAVTVGEGWRAVAKDHVRVIEGLRGVLEEALEKYGSHTDICSRWRSTSGDKRPCDCGFDAALALAPATPERGEHLFHFGTFTLHSGARSDFKIDCDALTDGDVRALAAKAARLLPAFGSVEGVPRGGMRLAGAMSAYVTAGPVLIVDDVLTTGASMEALRAGREAYGLVVFARGREPAWVLSLFRSTAALTPQALGDGGGA